jgi:RNA polymerase sigma factor (sigma-70 family)
MSERDFSLSTPNDADLLRRARRDPALFATVYDRHHRSVYRWLRSRVDDDATALDLTAETFAQALTNLSRFRNEAEGSAAPWLFGIANNLLAKYHRRRVVERNARRRLGMPVRTYPDPGIERVESELSSRPLHAALLALSEGERTALELRIIDDMSYEEVGDHLSISAPAARKRVMRALRSLRGRLEGVTP